MLPTLQLRAIRFARQAQLQNGFCLRGTPNYIAGLPEIGTRDFAEFKQT